MSSRTFAALLAMILLLAGPARAQLTIEIIGGGANQIPIAVLPFAGESVLPQSITEIVEQDLSRSGRFRAIFVGGVNPLPTEIAQVSFPEWKSRRADPPHGAQDRRFHLREDDRRARRVQHEDRLHRQAGPAP